MSDPILSFENGEPLAKIKGGEFSGKIVHVYVPPRTEEKKKTIEKRIKHPDPLALFTGKELKKYKKKLTRKEMDFLRSQLLKKMSYTEESKSESDSDSSDSEDLIEDLAFFNEMKKEAESKSLKEISLQSGFMSQVPNKKSRTVLYIAGLSNCGKSTYACDFMENYHKCFPDRKIFIISNVEEDIAFKKLEFYKIALDKALIETPPTIAKLKGSLVLFDDVDCIFDDKMKKAVQKLKQLILQTGRSHSGNGKDNVDIITTSHEITNHSESKTSITEATHIVCFPSSGNTHSIKYFCEKYLGLSKAQIKRILEIKSRWVCIKKSYPRVVLYETGCYLLLNE
jgi:hypothetical protein